MKIKMINFEDLKKMYNLEIDKKNVKEYMDFYSLYRYYLEEYLKKTLFLNELNQEFKKSNLGIEIKSLYRNISSLNLEYILLLNNILIENLSKQEVEKFKYICESKNEIMIYDFIKSTYKKLLDNNGILILGVSVKDDKRLNDYLKMRSNEYLKILNIPVSITNISETKVPKKYLPIGSVVYLKEGITKLMIIGFSHIDRERQIYDYLACLYPEGIFDKEINIVFNHKDIRKVLCLGYSDEEEKAYNKKSNERLKNKEELKEILETFRKVRR